MNITDLTTGDLATYGIVGTLLPLVVSIVNRPGMAAWLKQLIMVAFSVAAGIFAYGTKNGWDFSDPGNVMTAILGVITVTQAAYHLFWGKGVAPAIEMNVNGGPVAATPQHAADEVDETNDPVEGDSSPDEDADIDEDDPEDDDDTVTDGAPVPGDDDASYVDGASTGPDSPVVPAAAGGTTPQAS